MKFPLERIVVEFQILFAQGRGNEYGLQISGCARFQPSRSDAPVFGNELLLALVTHGFFRLRLGPLQAFASVRMRFDQR
jgi:hypothetical protein